jgi:hypothetical protein
MNRKIIGAILLSAAGLVAAIGAVGAQIAFAICQSAIYHQGYGVSVPPVLGNVSLHWAVILTALVLGASGFFFLFGRDKSQGA